jgi:hypothetical protein
MLCQYLANTGDAQKAACCQPGTTGKIMAFKLRQNALQHKLEEELL